MTHLILLGLVLAFVPRLARAELEAALSLEDVLRSVETHHPQLAADLLAVRSAEQEARAARGAFDTQLSVRGQVAPLGYYDYQRADVSLEQPIPVGGLALYSGYRLGRGNIAPYYGEQRTLSAGEVRGGMRASLLQDRSIDAPRAALRSAKLAEEASQAGYEGTRLSLAREAASAYFAWVAAGLRLHIYEDLLALAETRNAQIESKVELGALAPIEALDNQRAILERTRQRIAARRAFEQASIALSLYWRDPAGRPQEAALHHLPSALPEPSLAGTTLADAQSTALARRPELRRVQLGVQTLQVERALAQNRMWPKLDVFLQVSKDLGNATTDTAYTLRPLTLELGANLSMPLWLRTARGKLQSTQAKLSAEGHKLQFARDKVSAEVRDAISQLSAARERVSVARSAAEASLRVADGERERFELGASSVLFLNLREQTAAEAQVALIEAQAELNFAAARLQTAQGKPLALAAQR